MLNGYNSRIIYEKYFTIDHCIKILIQFDFNQFVSNWITNSQILF